MGVNRSEADFNFSCKVLERLAKPSAYMFKPRVANSARSRGVSSGPAGRKGELGSARGDARRLRSLLQSLAFYYQRAATARITFCIRARVDNVQLRFLKLSPGLAPRSDYR